MADSEGSWQIGTDTASAIALTEFGQWSPTDGDPDNDLWSLADASIRPVSFRALKRGITQLAEIADGTRSVLALDVTGTVSAASATFREAATVPGGAPSAGTARLWVKDDTPNTLYFTDDAGTDWLIGGTGAAQTLAETLGEGNATGGANIEVTNGDAIVGEDGGSITFATGTGLITTTTMCAGDPGTENGGITVSGGTYQSSLKVSDLGGSHVAQFILHRHSTTLPPFIVSARSHTDDDTHAIVEDGDLLFGIIACGWDGVDYAPGGSLQFGVSGTPGSGDMPTRFAVLLSPAGSETLTERLVIEPDGAVSIGGPLLLAGAESGDAYTTADDLVIGDGSGARGLTLFTGSGNSGFIAFSDTAGGAPQGSVSYSHTQNRISIGADSSTRLYVGSTASYPGSDNSFDLGSTSFAWRNVYVGTSVIAPTLQVAEAASTPGGAPGAGNSKFWAENTAPTTPKFTDDTNVEHTLAYDFSPAYHRVEGADSRGSTNTRIYRWPNVSDSAGSDITFTDSSTDGSYWTINTDGIYTISVSVASTAIVSHAINVASALSNTFLASHVRTLSNTVVKNLPATLSWTGPVSAGDLVWISTDTEADPDNTLYFNNGTIVRVR